MVPDPGPSPLESARGTDDGPTADPPADPIADPTPAGAAAVTDAPEGDDLLAAMTQDLVEFSAAMW